MGKFPTGYSLRRFFQKSKFLKTVHIASAAENEPRVSLVYDAIVGNESQEGCLIGQDVSMHLLCHHQTCAHTGVCRGVPLRVGSEGLCLLRDTQSLRPQGQLLGVGAGTVATGDEGIRPPQWLQTHPERKLPP